MSEKTLFSDEITNEIEDLAEYVQGNLANLTENYSSAISETLAQPVLQFDTYVQQFVEYLTPVGLAAFIPLIVGIGFILAKLIFIFVRVAFYTPFNQSTVPVFGDKISQKFGNMQFKDFDFIWKIIRGKCIISPYYVPLIVRSSCLRFLSFYFSHRQRSSQSAKAEAMNYWPLLLIG